MLRTERPVTEHACQTHNWCECTLQMLGRQELKLELESEIKQFEEDAQRQKGSAEELERRAEVQKQQAAQLAEREQQLELVETAQLDEHTRLENQAAAIVTERLQLDMSKNELSAQQASFKKDKQLLQSLQVTTLRELFRILKAFQDLFAKAPHVLIGLQHCATQPGSVAASSVPRTTNEHASRHVPCQLSREQPPL